MAAVTLRIFALLLLVTVCATDAVAKKKKKLTAVEDMRYGVALYHYYLGDYMQALTELLIAKERGGIKGHGDNPEIMEGGFSLGFGMERHASDIFERLLSQNRSRKSQDAAWFFLSKLRYLRGDFEDAEVALSKVRKKPSIDIRSEFYAHRINLAIQQNDLEKAERLLKKRPPDIDWLPYLYFNMGAAYSRQQNFKGAIKYFEKLGFDEYPTDELRALYDKAMTSAGYVYMMTEDYEKAIGKFSQVRLTSAHSNRALLGYGWAAARLERFNEALKPWQYLANSSLVDENSQEALIAVPYAYEKLGSEGLALEHFQLAEKVFLDERVRLNSVIESMNGNQLLDALRIERSDGLDWLKHVRENQVTPQLGYLAELFSREEFQGVVHELRDLVGIKEDLIAWQEKMDFYTDLIDEREVGRAKQLEKLAAKELAENIRKMKAKRLELAQKIESIAANKNVLGLANSEENELISRIVRGQRNIELLRETDPFIDEKEESIRRYDGIMLWDLSEKFSDRLWRVIKTLNLLDKTLATVKSNHEKVEYLVNNSEDLEPFKVRTAEAKDNIEIMLAQVDLVIDKTQDDLRAQTAEVLSNQLFRLNHYIAQSRLSIARLYDKALQATLQPGAEEDAEGEASNNGEDEGFNDAEGSNESAAPSEEEGEEESSETTPAAEPTTQNTAPDNLEAEDPVQEAGSDESNAPQETQNNDQQGVPQENGEDETAEQETSADTSSQEVNP